MGIAVAAGPRVSNGLAAGRSFGVGSGENSDDYLDVSGARVAFSIRRGWDGGHAIMEGVAGDGDGFSVGMGRIAVGGMGRRFWKMGGAIGEGTGFVDGDGIAVDRGRFDVFGSFLSRRISIDCVVSDSSTWYLLQPIRLVV